MMKKLSVIFHLGLFCALLSAGEPSAILFDKLIDWHADRGFAQAGEGVFSMSVPNTIVRTEQFFPIDPSRPVSLSGEFRIEDTRNLYFGFLLYDKDRRQIRYPEVHIIRETESVLAAPCVKTDRQIRVRDGEKYKNLPKNQFIAFNIRQDLSDLPNRQLARIQEIVLEKDGSAVLKLQKPAGLDAPAGTAVRAHSHGNWFYAGSCGSKIDSQWRSFQCTVSGTDHQENRRRWWYGTAFARVFLYANSRGKKAEPPLLFKNIRISGIPEKKMTAAGTSMHEFPAGADEISFRLTGQAQQIYLFPESSLPQLISVISAPLKLSKGGSIPHARLALQPFNVSYQTIRPQKQNEKDEDYMKNCGRPCQPPVLTIRRNRSGEQTFLLNGSFIGCWKTGRNLKAVGNLPADTKVSFSRIPEKDDRYYTIDFSHIGNPGSLQGAEPGEISCGIPFSRAAGNHYDLGLTARQKVLNEHGSSLQTLAATWTVMVPAEQYSRAWILCAVDQDPKKDRAFNVRMTRYIKGRWNGRSWDAMGNTAVSINGQEQTVGTVRIKDRTLPLLLVEVPLKTGQIQDIVFNEQRGTHSRMKFGRYLDLEISGRLISIRAPFGDERHLPDPGKVSAVHLFGVTLEKPGAEMEAVTIQPGNIFHNDEIPETLVKIRQRRPGKYCLRWTIRNPEGEITAMGSHPVGKKEETVRVSLAQELPGWYQLDYELLEGDRVLLTHPASFALLGRDTRKAGMADSPYGTWCFGGAHFTADKLEIVAPVLFKAGFRRSQGISRYPAAERRKWQLMPSVIYRKGKTPEEIIANTRKLTAQDPELKSVMIFHESAPAAYEIAPELTNQKWLPEYEWKNKDKRFKEAMMLGKLYRENFPQLKITIGNSLACTKLIAEMIRAGFPEKYADYMGLEVVSRNNLPERQWSSSLQSADLMRQLAEKVGYKSWKVNACFESNYRLDSLIGREHQAEWYTRDLILSQAWRFPDIFVALLMDAGNLYSRSFWGATGLCIRAPFIYPKQSYVAIATATKMLDQVTGYTPIPTGSESVYLAQFDRRDGKTAYVIWTSRGTAGLQLDLDRGHYQRFDFYGRPLPVIPGPAKLDLTAGTKVQYLIADRPIVKSAKMGRRTYPEDQPRNKRVLVKNLDSIDEWELQTEKDPMLEHTTGVHTPYRTLGKYQLRQVTDSEMGDCLELELTAPDYSLPLIMEEYAVVSLKKPVVMNGNPNTLGMMVKGNSGWGQVYWVLQDARGKRSISCGTRNHQVDVFDYDGRMSVCFDGWNYLSFPVTSKSSIPDLSTGSVSNLWMREDNSAPAYPVKLVGVAFSAQSRPLFLTQRKKYRQVIRFKSVWGEDLKP